MSYVLGLDVGGSSIKAGAVDLQAGHVVGALRSVAMPARATPDQTRTAIGEIVRMFPECTGPVGMAFPAVVKAGVAMTAANIDRAWIGTDAAALLTAAAGRPGSVLNDASAAGLAEARVGAGRGVPGLAMLLTFGTGIGSALIANGQLIPNMELGHLEVDGREAELQASARVRTAEGLDWPAWCERVNRVLAAYERLLWPDLFILGGGVSEHFEEFGHLLRTRARVVPATLRQTAGVVGAALYAVAGLGG